jgi:hypothetical protein
MSSSLSTIRADVSQYDRQWAIRETATSQMCTAREFPSVGSSDSRKTQADCAQMVLIAPEIDEERNLLVVRFPKGTGLPGFAVKLHVDEEEIRTWAK